MNITIGADPEVFLTKSGVPVTPTGLVPGHKRKPEPVKNGSIQRDGTAAEFNIDPCESVEQFCYKIDSVIDQLINISGCELDPVVIRDWGDSIFSMSSDERNLGCEADYNAWTESVNKKPSKDVTFRTAGGHVHLGFLEGGDSSWDYHHYIRPLIKIMDENLGVPSLMWDDDGKRRNLYGRAGAYRAKPFGAEYRSLSNSWVFKEHLKKFVFDQSVKSVEMFLDGYKPKDNLSEIIINTNDVLEAENFCKNLGVNPDDLRR